MDLEKKLEEFYADVRMPMEQAEATKNFNSITIWGYSFAYKMNDIIKCYCAIEEDNQKLKDRYKHLLKIYYYNEHKKKDYRESFVLPHLILFGNLEEALQNINYSTYKSHICRIMSFQMPIHKVFESLNQYFNKELTEYVNKYIDIINSENAETTFKNMDRDAVIPLFALCAMANTEESNKYIDIIIKALDYMPNKLDALNVIAPIINKHKSLRDKFEEILNNDETLIIDINTEFGNYFYRVAFSDKDKIIDKTYKELDFPNYFSFIAKYFDNYFYINILHNFKKLYLNDKEGFYKLYNLLKSENYITRKNIKIIFILFSAVLLEHNDNNFDLETFKLCCQIIPSIILKCLKKEDSQDVNKISNNIKNLEDVFNKDKNKAFNDLIEYFTGKKSSNNCYRFRATYPEINLNTDMMYVFALFNFEDLCEETKSLKKFSIDVLKHLTIQLGIRKYIETQYAITSKTFREIADSLINNEELNITLKEILLSYYYDYGNYYMPPPSLYNSLTDEKDNIKTLKDLLIENYKEELKNILDDKNFIKKELSNEKLAILDILKWAYNPNFNYNNFDLVYTVLESSKKIEVKRACLKIISDNEDITREYVEKTIDKVKAADLKGALKTILKNWNLKKYGDKFNNTDEAIEFINTYYNTSYENSIKFLENIKFDKVLYKNGNEADERIIKYIFIEYMNLTEPARLKDCDMLADLLEINSFQKVLSDVFNYWKESNYDNKEKNILMPYCIYSDNSKIDAVYSLIKEFAKGSRTILGAFIVKCIALNGKNYALILVDNLTRKAPTAKIKETANETMKNAAEILDISTDELSDIIIPDFGFDRKGNKVLSYGGEANRTFTLNINNNLELTINDDEKNKIIKSLPAANSKDDKTMADSVKKEFTSLKKEIKTLIQSQKIRLQRVFMNGRKWNYESFKNVFVNNSIMNIFALKLIWGVYDDNNKLIESFRYMEDGTFNTADEEEYKLENTNKKNITLVHPIELDENTLNKWKQQLTDYEINQPIEQLNFKYETIEEKYIQDDEINAFEGITVKAGTLMSFSNKYDLARGETEDGGSYSEYILKDSYLKISAHITFDYMYFGINPDENINLNNIIFYDESDELQPVKTNPLKLNKRFVNSFYSIIKNSI
ncbi:DUF4132 domain-containing protein [Brachyspira sp.]|uniref:DUF4132 domain-containing protein n=1 Tax=Brachyspira sp. TaxID=1977261 RepID=UPI002617842E|nr:DUF4132 domain-containing protein [Brachyspira sp.]